MNTNNTNVDPKDKKKIWITVIVMGITMFVGAFAFDEQYFGPSIPIGIVLTIGINALFK
jgi:hypothetical protein